jgi:hypothetical protein
MFEPLLHVANHEADMPPALDLSILGNFRDRKARATLDALRSKVQVCFNCFFSVASEARS